MGEQGSADDDRAVPNRDDQGGPDQRRGEAPRHHPGPVGDHRRGGAPSVVTALQNGQEVEIRGFGSFRFRNRAPRKGRNPKTGEKVDVPPKKIPYFKMGKELKALLNGASPAESTPASGEP